MHPTLQRLSQTCAMTVKHTKATDLLFYIDASKQSDPMAIKVFIPVTLFCSALPLFFSSLHVFLIVGRLLVPESA